MAAPGYFPITNNMSPYSGGQFAPQQVQVQGQPTVGNPMSAITNMGSHIGGSFLQPIQSGIDSFGAANFGTGAGQSVVGAMGPMQPAATAGQLTSASLSGILGASGMGFFGGGIVSKMLGGNETVGSFAGGAGAGIGMAVGGPVGAVAGGLLGGLAGGLFGGKKKSDMVQSGGVSITDGNVNDYYSSSQSSTGKKFSQANAGTRDQLQNSVSTFTKYLLANGATPVWGKKEDRDIIMQYGSRDGYRWWFEGADKPNNYGNNYGGFSQSLVDQTLKQYNIPDSLKTQLQGMNTKDIVGLANGLNKQQQAKSTGAAMSNNWAIPHREDMGHESFDQFLQRYRSTYAS